MRRRRLMWRNIASNALTLLIVALVAMAGLVAWGKARYQAPGPLAQAICLRVESGANHRPRSAPSLTRAGRDRPSGWLFRRRRRLFRQGRQAEGGQLPDHRRRVDGGDRRRDHRHRACRPAAPRWSTGSGVRVAEMQVRELDPATNRFVEVAEFDPRARAIRCRTAIRKVRGREGYPLPGALAEGVTSWQVVEALKAADFLAGDGRRTCRPRGCWRRTATRWRRAPTAANCSARMQAAQAGAAGRGLDGSRRRACR